MLIPFFFHSIFFFSTDALLDLPVEHPDISFVARVSCLPPGGKLIHNHYARHSVDLGAGEETANDEKPDISPEDDRVRDVCPADGNDDREEEEEDDIIEAFEQQEDDEDDEHRPPLDEYDNDNDDDEEEEDEEEEGNDQDEKEEKEDSTG
ncbi:Surface-associated interspersed protein 13.1 (SURFIN 13.1) [Balamuthia mandrillaris]